MISPGTSRVSPPRIDAEQLYLEHASFVASFAHRLGVEGADVDDLVQEVFLVAHRKGGYVEGPATARSWLGAIVVRVASTARRTRTRRREDYDPVALEQTRSRAGSPADALEVSQALLRVQRALDELADEHRAVFVLYEIEREPCASIASALGVPIGTVYSRLHHARDRFRTAHAGLVRAEHGETGSEPLRRTGSDR